MDFRTRKKTEEINTEECARTSTFISTNQGVIQRLFGHIDLFARETLFPENFENWVSYIAGNITFEVFSGENIQIST